MLCAAELNLKLKITHMCLFCWNFCGWKFYVRFHQRGKPPTLFSCRPNVACYLQSFVILGSLDWWLFGILEDRYCVRCFYFVTFGVTIQNCRSFFCNRFVSGPLLAYNLQLLLRQFRSHLSFHLFFILLLLLSTCSLLFLSLYMSTC